MTGKSVQQFGDKLYWDMRTPVLSERDPAPAIDLSNWEFHERGGLEGRHGSHVMQDTLGGFGLFPYIYETTADVLTEEMLTVDENLHKLVEGSLTISYTGTNVNSYATVYVSAGAMFCDLYDNGTRVLNANLGTGFNVTTPVTMASLKTDIDAVAAFDATIVGTTTVPAAV